MAMGATHSKTTSAGSGHRSRMACLTFINPRCPAAPTAVEAKGAEVDQGGVVEDSEGGVVTKE